MWSRWGSRSHGPAGEAQPAAVGRERDIPGGVALTHLARMWRAGQLREEKDSQTPSSLVSAPDRRLMTLSFYTWS